MRIAGLALALLLIGERTPSHTTDTVMMRGRPQIVHVYGMRGAGDPVIVSSGDGGWIHLGPHVADLLVAKGYFVVGFDVKAYLKSFTANSGTLRPEDVPGDYKVLAEYAGRGSTRKPVLIGVSEGAGLSVLAASDPATKPVVGGVMALGLPDRNELGWRWKDSLIYVTHGVPNEPSFRAADVIDKVTPVPLAAIHSTRDEFVPLSVITQLMARAQAPKHLWIVPASDHRFSDRIEEFDRVLLESLEWMRGQSG